MVRAGLAAAAVLSISLGGLLPASAAELPIRRPGLWEIKIKLTGGAAPTAMMHHCTDESTDRQMSTMFNPLAPHHCPKSDIQKHAEHYTIDAVCRIDNKTFAVHADVTGDFQTSYTVAAEKKIQDEPDSAPVVSNVTLEGRFVGACKPDQKPGDVMMAGGMKINIKEMEGFKNLRKQ
ncbi:DUF3617 family protein [Bradyrhizobium sp. LHD-71]|uniref:DUF3617 domain-containing protein n=1 Tax=Bradyrhizobium sp. LHD-71 TaxID=3072141 RepID=UPI00280D0080|nr:DUF3617 family protein [Bradyrhizobium sp. LHD-71]MDQ8729006.1 DUF3617 family protein [Bradyrhizobium sp. LHD-71]